MKKTLIFSGMKQLGWYLKDITNNKYNIIQISSYNELKKHIQSISTFLYIYEDSTELNENKICSIIRKQAPHVFILYSTIMLNESYIDKRLSVGFDDYIIFQPPLERNARKIHIVDKKHNLIVDSYVDSLTKCYNRKYLETRSYINNGSVAMIDVDNFKYVNDIYGHIEGDRVLSEIGRLIRQWFKNEEVIRYGGDEFLIIFKKNKKIYNKLCNLKKKVREIMSGNISISIGLSNNKNNVLELIKEADQNVYKAKRSGKNKVIG